MFTLEDAIDVLTLAAAYDRRTVGHADALAWHDAATRGRWTRDAALEAVKVHYARSADWLMPGHVNELVRAERRQPPPIREVLGELPPGMPRLHAIPGEELTPWPSKPARRRALTTEERARARAELDGIRPADAAAEDAS